MTIDNSFYGAYVRGIFAQCPTARAAEKAAEVASNMHQSVLACALRHQACMLDALETGDTTAAAVESQRVGLCLRQLGV